MARTRAIACLLVAAFLLVAGTAYGQAPEIACDEPEHDFGKVAQGKEVEHIFKIKNKGKGVLKIERARGG